MPNCAMDRTVHRQNVVKYTYFSPTKTRLDAHGEALSGRPVLSNVVQKPSNGGGGGLGHPPHWHSFSAE